MEPFVPHSAGADFLYDQASCGLALTAEDGTFLTVNDTLCRWLGRAREDLVGKTKLPSLLTMGGRIFHQTHWAPLLRMQGSVSEVKLEVVHASGEIFPMVLNAIGRRADRGIVHDISMFIARDRDAYERELVASRKKLLGMVEEAAKLNAEAEDRALFAEQMVGIVSHDLRNPLSTIQMGASLLSRSPANQDAVLARVNRAAERALRLVGELLDFTQARLGKGIAVNVAPMDLRKCAAEVVEELSLAYPGRVVQHQHSGESACHADADRLAQLVGNLASNAIAYGLDAAPVEVITLVEGGVATIAVRNQGDPIPEAIQATLFQPMVRGDVDAASRSVGLGLFIVSEIAKAHGGSIRVESGPGIGTTFEISIPAIRRT